MSKYSDSKALKGLTLGKETTYANQYNASLLQPVPRSLNRDDLHLGQQLPFLGHDIWTLYELSWLNTNGLPQVAVGEVYIPATSANLIESKSFKLYLNSYNQTKFDSWEAVTKQLTTDLSACAEAPVVVQVKPVTDYTNQAIVTMQGTCIDDQNIIIDNYEFDANLLQGAVGSDNADSNNKNEQVSETLHSHLLKSNCLITNQPDWGSVEISYSGQQIDQEKLLRYLVSFREHNEFHEQCVERIFCDIMYHCQPEKLTVFARYTRRGGLDINPYRSTEQDKPSHNQRMARQ